MVTFETMLIDVYNISGEKTGDMELPDELVNIKISVPLLHEVVCAYLANQRSGNASTKTRGEVSGGGRKPWRQKHTGRARHGSIRSPLWRGGGITFGPKPRSYRVEISNRKKRISLKMAFASKLKENKVKILNEINLTSHKTKEFKKILESLKLPDKCLFITENRDRNLILASNNLKTVVKEYKYVNTYDILNSDELVFTKSTLERFISERL